MAFVNYNDFKKKFLLEFFSIPIKVKIKSAWLAKRFTPNKDTLQKYFLDQFNEAQYFLPKMEAYELHYTIVQQMPIHIRETLATVDFGSFDNISQALSQLDLTYNEKMLSQKKNVNYLSGGDEQNNTANRNISDNHHFKTKSRPVGVQSNSIHKVCCCQEGGNMSRISFSQPRQTAPMKSDFNTNACQENYRASLPDMRIPPPGYLNLQSHNTNSLNLN